MSSATVQTAPHQSTTVGTHSPVPATSSNRGYQSAAAPSSREPYYHSPTQNASPNAHRRPTRAASGNGASPNPQPPQHYSPAQTSTSVTQNRGTTANHASPVSSSMAPGDHQRGVPPVVSPRTSSNRTGAERSAVSRRPLPESATILLPRQQSGDGQQDRVDHQRGQNNGVPNGTTEDHAAAARQRRRAQQHASPEVLPHRPSGSRDREARSQPSPRDLPTPPTGLSREASEVLNRVVISNPQVDLERERERMAEAVPASPSTHVTPGGSRAAPGDSGEESARGPRSRQDHSNTGKREKSSKFGDYYLGATLGEGEFGKVKMGWKQGDDVQVSWAGARSISGAIANTLIGRRQADPPGQRRHESNPTCQDLPRDRHPSTDQSP